MPYAELRKIVLAEGWLPLVTPDCKENVGGEALICAQQPEVESCSGDGHCNMLFTHEASKAKLRVGTYDSTAKFWEFSELENSGNGIVNKGQESSFGADSLAADACTQKGYWSFFESFVKSEVIRNSHTSPMVEVRSYSTQEKIEGKYDQFKIGLVDYQWVYLNPAKNESNYDSLDLKEKLIGNTFRVDYQKAEYGADDELLKTFGDPGAYLFELKDSCWRLTQEFR